MFVRHQKKYKNTFTSANTKLNAKALDTINETINQIDCPDPSINFNFCLTCFAANISFATALVSMQFTPTNNLASSILIAALIFFSLLCIQQYQAFKKAKKLKEIIEKIKKLSDTEKT